MTTDLEVYADIVCPFTHAGLDRVVAALPTDATVRVRPWPLEWVNGAPLDPAHVAAEIDALRAEVAPDLFTGFDPGAFPRTSLLAHAAAERAYRAGDALGLEVSLALRAAVFEAGQDISEPRVVDRVLAASGLDGPEDADHDRVRTSFEEGRERGVVGSPHFFTSAGSWFCPGLDIAKVDGGFDVHVKTGPLEELLESIAGHED